jgi:hypothetical protein
VMYTIGKKKAKTKLVETATFPTPDALPPNITAAGAGLGFTGR